MKNKHLYSETRGEKPFDWMKYLANAYAKRTPYPSNEVQLLAKDWVTCACGNQCKIIPRNASGRPNDTKLQDLGANFFQRVCEGEWLKAIGILALIERRSAVIINRILARKPRLGGKTCNQSKCKQSS